MRFDSVNWYVGRGFDDVVLVDEVICGGLDPTPTATSTPTPTDTPTRAWCCPPGTVVPGGITASSEGPNPASNAIDGDTGTYWTPAQYAAPLTVSLTLTDAAWLDAVYIYPEYVPGSQVTEIALDGAVVYTAGHALTAYMWNTVTFTEKPAAEVRVTFSRPYSSSGYNIAEVTLSGCEQGECDDCLNLERTGWWSGAHDWQVFSLTYTATAPITVTAIIAYWQYADFFADLVGRDLQVVSIVDDYTSEVWGEGIDSYANTSSCDDVDFTWYMQQFVAGENTIGVGVEFSNTWSDIFTDTLLSDYGLRLEIEGCQIAVLPTPRVLPTGTPCAPGGNCDDDVCCMNARDAAFLAACLNEIGDETKCYQMLQNLGQPSW